MKFQVDPQSIIDGISKVMAVAAKFVPALADAQGAVESAVKVEQAAAPFAKLIWDHVVNKKVVTADDLAALDAGLVALSARIQAEIPPEQPDDI